MTRTGRPRQFDEQHALAQARDVFWSQGYEATSVQDLVTALAVQRGSLCAAFGDKRSLYLKAVSLYARAQPCSTSGRLGPGRPQRRAADQPLALGIDQLLSEPQPPALRWPRSDDAQPQLRAASHRISSPYSIPHERQMITNPGRSAGSRLLHRLGPPLVSKRELARQVDSRKLVTGGERRACRPSHAGADRLIHG